MAAKQNSGASLVRAIAIGSGIFCAALLPRILLAIFEPALAPDGNVYQTVANNILHNGCVSLAEPAARSCIPHWGGNQFPGFPAFIAFVWALFPNTWTSITVAHSFVFSLSVVYLWFALDEFLDSEITSVLVALAVALSPLSLPWARYNLTDTLALTVVVVISAELIRSLHQQKIRIPIIGLALCVGFFVRFDTILLSIPVAIMGFYLHPFARAIKRGSVIIAILLLPVLLWSGRGIAVGLGPLPNPFFLANGYEAPVGYLAWAKNWATSQYQAPLWWYPISMATYSKISPPAKAFKTEDQRSRVLNILDELKAYEGKQFPKHLDDRFLDLAREMKSRYTVNYWLVLPLQRLGLIWFNPLNSAGWPVNLGWRQGLPNLENLVSAAISNPSSALIKGGTAVYRMILPLAAIWILLLYRRKLSPLASILLWASLAHVVARSIFLGWGFYIESRYLLQVFPLLEVALALSLMELLHARNTSQPKDRNQ